MRVRKVAVAGGGGALGRLIVEELSSQGVEVVVLTRKKPDAPKINNSSGVMRELNYSSVEDMAKSLSDIDVVVSALAGVYSVIVEAQGRLIQAARLAGVGKFIPSDFSIDFRKIPEGENRNLNQRREFFERFENIPIRKTSILNGAFTEMLTGAAPFILFSLKRILCWGDPHQKMDWTTIGDTARFTAYAAIDETSPRFIRIAGDQISAEDLRIMMSDLTGDPYQILKPAGLKAFRKLINITRFLKPGEQEIYPPWQGMQYMHNMYSGIAKFDAIDNELYPVRFQSAKCILEEHLQSRGTLKTSFK